MTSHSLSKTGDVELSVVVAIYNEEEVLRPFFERLIPVLRKLTPSYEIICINDGSEDRSLDILRETAGRDSHLRVIDFSRNFGKEAALSAGLAEARIIGEYIGRNYEESKMRPLYLVRERIGFDRGERQTPVGEARDRKA